jgi:hypothetical protein
MVGATVIGACTNGSGGTGTTPQTLAPGYEPPTSPFQASGGQEQPTNPYQPPTGSVGGSGGGGGGGSCSYCGKTYTCAYSADGFTGSSQLTLPAATGNECILPEDGGTASFSCDGTLSYGGTSAPWTALAGGGFSYSLEESSASAAGLPTTTTSITITCTPGASASPGSGFSEDGG